MEWGGTPDVLRISELPIILSFSDQKFCLGSKKNHPSKLVVCSHKNFWLQWINIFWNTSAYYELFGCFFDQEKKHFIMFVRVMYRSAFSSYYHFSDWFHPFVFILLQNEKINKVGLFYISALLWIRPAPELTSIVPSGVSNKQLWCNREGKSYF